MNAISDNDVIAYVDGVLDASARTAFERRMDEDPALAQRVAAHRWMTRQIVSAYGPPPGDEVDAALLARLGLAGENVVPIMRRSTKMGTGTKWGFIAFAAAAAMAASLVVGVGIGRRIDDQPRAWVRGAPDTQLVADGALAQSLSRQLSGEAGPVRIGMSFRAGQGVCRTFSTANGLSGLGCRRNARWEVPIVVGGGASTGKSDYRLAGGEVAPAVMAEVDRRIVGEPLSADAERTSKANDWQK